MQGRGDPARDLKALHQNDFLRKWHSLFAGATSRTFACGRIDETSGSSYDLLVADVAALQVADCVVDLACGDGYLIERLAQRLPNSTIIGVDQSEEELELARRRSFGEQVSLRIAPAEKLPLPDGSVAAIVCHLALMLFEDAAKVLHEAARVLRPDGIFAAVLGPASGASEIVLTFLRRLREIESKEGLEVLRVGDASTYAEASLKELFGGGDWCSVDVCDARIRFEGPGERIEAVLLAMYNVARLSNAGRAQLASDLRQSIAEQRAAGEGLDCAIGSRHLVARRSKRRTPALG